MTPELQAFIDFFSNEEELRSAVEGLLFRREECRGVRNLHGKDEAGKDIVFYASSALGRSRLNACVIKLAKITGSASDPSSGARNVLIQCDQALDTPVLTSHGQEEWVSHIYVMSPNELSATTMQSIGGRLKGRPSQIDFICGQEFLQLFKQCWPGFIFFQPDLLSAHLETIRKELESDAEIEKLAMIHGLSMATRERNIYVEPTLMQLRGKLFRGVALPDRQFFANAHSEDVTRLRAQLDELISSLRIMHHLPRQPIDLIKDLADWPLKVERHWNDAFSRDRNQSINRVAAPSLWHVPSWFVDSFFESREYQYFSRVFSTLDKEIAAANMSLSGFGDRVQLLDSPSFGAYGALVHAATDCYPTIRIDSNEIIEWSSEEILATNRNLLITGGPGMGKTSFCRNHFLRDLERFKRNESNILPLYFAAHSLIITPEGSFEETFIRPEVQDRLALDPSLLVRIYLDGLDEIRSIEVREGILEIVRQGCQAKDSRYRCLATARDQVGGYSTRWLPRLSISPMEKSAMHDLTSAWLDKDEGLISLFFSELHSTGSLGQVISVPLLATLTILVFKNLRRLPENRLRLFQMFIDLLLGGWNLVKGSKRAYQYSSTTKLSILTRLSGIMHSLKKKECSVSEFGVAMKQVAQSLISDAQGVLSELAEDGLLVPTGRATYTLPHLSFQEYLAARDAIDPAREEERRIIEKFLSGDDWYKEVASFIISMTTNPARMQDWIDSIASPDLSWNARSGRERRIAYLKEQLSQAFC